MRKTLIYILLFTFLTSHLYAHRVILKSGEQLSGDLKETEGTSDYIIITTEGEDIKIFKKRHSRNIFRRGRKSSLYSF
ncbi:hypothetical protein LEP1GSC037_0058 [Leptospira interrogans str. 2006001854]|uniref:Uncharacterized protein n=1 Tax=Leptospira interrogans str. 2006001854 TaxID=1001590 RepID=M6GA16_LEPIR|nr:hypothetical protein LEP1GSC037_0058 [Leptospira interrogans str. 2006001854]